MKIMLTISVITVFMVIIFTVGCTGGGGQTTPAQTVLPTPIDTIVVSTTAHTTSAGAGSTQPGPTQTIPPGEAVSVSVEKAGTYSTTIIAHFDGGKGINFVSKIEVRVTRPDGSTEIKNLQPEVGKEVEIEGTQGTDRVEVTAYMKSGKIYKIIDQQMPYKRRG
jgi:hypothetical protein